MVIPLLTQSSRFPVLLRHTHPQYNQFILEPRFLNSQLPGDLF
jgi:hypothetical protein